MRSPTLLGVIICVPAATLEGALAGKDARQWLAQLRMPRYSPPFVLWVVIGVLFYAMCFVILRHILTTDLASHSQFLCARADGSAPPRKRALERPVLSMA